MDGSPLLSVEDSLVGAWKVARAEWRALVAVSALGWLPFACALLSLVLAGERFGALPPLGTPLQELPQRLAEVEPTAASALSATLIVLLLLLAYASSVALVSGAAVAAADGTCSGERITARAALAASARRLHRSVRAYLVLSGSLIALMLVAVVGSVGAGAWLAATLSPVAGALGAGVCLLVLGLSGIAGWLALYSRWAFALQEAVLAPDTRTSPLRQSSAVTQGRRRGILGRVLLVNLAVAVAAGSFGALLLLLQASGGHLLMVALLGRILLSVLTGAFTAAGVTPLFEVAAGRQQGGLRPVDGVRRLPPRP